MTSLGWAELGPVELALVAERLGSGAVPSPLVVTGALRNALPELAAEHPPEAVLTFAALRPGAPNEWASPVHEGADTLTGTYLLVPYARGADHIVVPNAHGLCVIDPTHSGATLTRHHTIGGDPLWRLECDAVPSGLVPGALGHVLDHLAVASLAYGVGVAQTALALSVQHAKDRHQFGRPIGSFQGVAHRCADMRAEVDACQVLVLRAAWALERGVEVELAICSALAYAKDALRRVAMHAHQVHGALGFSTEHDLPVFTRRIKAFELSYGNTALYQERLAAAIGLV
jgi:alkylation response protein AidB-like acyl-CoA dehydrogenase